MDRHAFYIICLGLALILLGLTLQIIARFG